MRCTCEINREDLIMSLEWFDSSLTNCTLFPESKLYPCKACHQDFLLQPQLRHLNAVALMIWDKLFDKTWMKNQKYICIYIVMQWYYDAVILTPYLMLGLQRSRQVNENLSPVGRLTYEIVMSCISAGVNMDLSGIEINETNKR